MAEFINEDLKGFHAYWKSFIKDKKEVTFYVNPGPHYLTDVLMMKNKTDKIIDENLIPCKDYFDIGANIAYSFASEIGSASLEPDWFLTTLVHQYNNLNSNLQLVIGGYPQLALRDFIVRSYSFDQIYGAFGEMLSEFNKGKLNFDPQYLMTDYWINPQADYITAL